MGQTSTAHSLREQLMSPRAIERVHGLHALERALQGAPNGAAALALEAFTARGVPYYAPQDASYQAWVDTAIGHWDALQQLQAQGGAGVPRMRARQRSDRSTHPA